MIKIFGEDVTWFEVAEGGDLWWTPMFRVVPESSRSEIENEAVRDFGGLVHHILGLFVFFWTFLNNVRKYLIILTYRLSKYT